MAGGDEENMPKKEDMATKSIHFDDFLGILWGIATANTPGSYEDFYEGLKVRSPFTHMSQSCMTPLSKS